MTRRRDPVLQRLVDTHGIAAKIARALNITRPAVWHWRRVPAEHVITVEEVTRIPRHEIRPDIYPPPGSARARVINEVSPT